MKVKLISDVHLEFDRDGGARFCESLPNENADVLVIAGDFASTRYPNSFAIFEDNFKRLCDRFPQVVYVMGNHDYWYGRIEEKKDSMARLTSKFSNLHWLDNRRVQIGEHFFAGGTLWFPECKIRNNWPDFRFVDNGPYAIFEEFEKTYKFLRENIQKGDIVVTHHLPAQECVAPRWEDNDWNCYFVGDVDDVIYGKEPSHWFFGHTHDARNLSIWATHLICNPRGYPSEGVLFDPHLIIDLDVEKKYT